MNIVRKAVLVSGLMVVTGSTVFSQKSESSGWFVEFGGATLVPQAQPAGLGGAVAGGYSTRDFNILLRPQVLIAEPGVAQRLLMIPAFLFEWKVPLSPGFITLLPYINGGVIGGKILKSDGNLSSTVFTYFAEAGVGAEFIMTHEISLVPRLGIASALLYADRDSGNYSGMTVSAAVRYTFGRAKTLDY